MSGSNPARAGHVPRVSICMITYNHEPFIRRAIKGALDQESQFTFELVIGEDHSTDRTREICLEQEQMHPDLIRVLESDVNLGITKNFFRTLAACRGKYIAMCEGDDFWTDRMKLQRQVKFLEENPEYVMISGRVEIVNEHGLTPGDTRQLEEQLRRLKREPTFFDLLEYNMINTPTVCIRRDVIIKHANEAISRRIWFSVDYWYWLRCAAEGRIYIADEVYSSYRIHPGGASRQGTFLRKRMPWIRFDAISCFVEGHDVIPAAEKASLFASMVGIMAGKGGDFRLRIMTLLWCLRNISSFRAWSANRFKGVR